MAHGMSGEDKVILDIVSVGAVVGALTNFLPAVAALFTIIWTGLRIYESPTVQKWLGHPLEGNKNETH